MRTLIHLGLGLSLGLGFVACTDDVTADKPARDPDQTLATAKGDLATDWYTTIRGPLALGETLHEDIDYPDFYLGRTIELRAGQEVRFDVTSNRKSIVRVYGPAFDVVDGQPLFGKAAVKGETKKVGKNQVASLTFTAPDAGTYLLLYGPQNVWLATYDISATCVSGCLPADACTSDDACPGDEFCGWNGVACIRAPCDAAYDVCRARQDVGLGCDRDRACAEGLSCQDGTCQGGTVALGGKCQINSDCQNGWCACVDNTCSAQTCKAYAAEGETCGGFRIASARQMCAPSFDCVAPYDIIADIPGHCGHMTTVAEVLADPARFDGKYIAVKGAIDASAIGCTKIGCDAANPCCNQCGIDERLVDDAAQAQTLGGIYLSQNGADLHCAGNECNVADSCPVAAGNAWVGGWFNVTDGQPKLAIDRVYRY